MQPLLHLLRLRHASQHRLQTPRLNQLPRIRFLILIISRRVSAPNKQDVANLELDFLVFGNGEQLLELDGVRSEGVVRSPNLLAPGVVIEEHAAADDPMVGDGLDAASCACSSR